VGLARKIGADICCALIDKGDVTSPLIHMSDADVVLPPDYFDIDFQVPGLTLYPFAHSADDAQLSRAAELYELHLHHYVNGLRAAGSPYAYQSLGSTIVADAVTYATVRGMPKRNAAEDFYFLNKAAKVAPVISLAHPEIRIAARRSTRVPFGTGPALANIPDDLETYLSYAPQVFEHLREAIEDLDRFALHDQTPDPNLPHQCWLTELGWMQYAAAVRLQHPAGSHRHRSVMEWFDGFRTLRFIRLASKRIAMTPLMDTLRAQWEMPEADLSSLRAVIRSRRETVGGLSARLNPKKRTG
jgi:hypothetical protein